MVPGDLQKGVVGDAAGRVETEDRFEILQRLFVVTVVREGDPALEAPHRELVVRLTGAHDGGAQTDDAHDAGDTWLRLSHGAGAKVDLFHLPGLDRDLTAPALAGVRTLTGDGVPPGRDRAARDRRESDVLLVDQDLTVARP